MPPNGVCVRGDLDAVVFGGAMFANRRLSNELGRLLGDRLALAAVPEPAGRALGAALSTPAGFGEPLAGLALGPSFSDPDIKRTLDNCRLDYVYEPDWQRLFLRTSKLLSQGKVVAWFQGAMGFGPRAMGTRSILCDPSSRYARPQHERVSQTGPARRAAARRLRAIDRRRLPDASGLGPARRDGRGGGVGVARPIGRRARLAPLRQGPRREPGAGA